MNKYRRLSLLFGLLTIISLVAFACGGDDDDDNSGGEDPATNAPTEASDGAGGDVDEGESGGELVIAMSAANIPIPDTAPTEGNEGYRFVGFQLYDGLVNWDLSQGDTLAELKPGLAESWEVSDDQLTWTFSVRPGVSFHDGTPVDAPAFEFAFRRTFDSDFDYFNASSAGASLLATGLVGYEALDEMTFALTTSTPDALVLEKLVTILIPSPTQVMALGDTFADDPVGSGPFMFESLTPGQRMVMVKNPDYWDGAPLLDRIVLRPIPEPATRLAALQSGEVDWAETPPTEAISSLEDDGFQVILKEYPHIWPWQFLFNDVEGDSPLDDKLVRQAMNYAIDREALCDILLSGACEPAYGFVYPGHPWYGDAEPYSYDPDRARELLAEAGYEDGFEFTIMSSSSGSGQMWPPLMNDFLATNLREVGIDVRIDTREWNSLLGTLLAGDFGDADAINISLSFDTPTTLTFPFAAGPTNLFGYDNEETASLIAEAGLEFDEAVQAAELQEIHEKVVQDAPWLFIVHDSNLRAMAPYVEGFVPVQSWFADLTTITIDES